MALKCRDVRTREVGIQEIHHKVKPYEVGRICLALMCVLLCGNFVCGLCVGFLVKTAAPATLTRATKLLLKYRPTYSLVTIPILSALHHLPTLQPTTSTPTPTPPTHAGDWGKEGTQLGCVRASVGHCSDLPLFGAVFAYKLWRCARPCPLVCCVYLMV